MQLPSFVSFANSICSVRFYLVRFRQFMNTKGYSLLLLGITSEFFKIYFLEHAQVLLTNIIHAVKLEAGLRTFSLGKC